MNIPSTIKIGSIIYDIEIENVKHKGLTEDDPWGKIDFDECKIYLHGGVNEQILDEIFMHEVIHGIEHNFCLDFKESEVDRLSHGITAFLKENLLLKE